MANISVLDTDIMYLKGVGPRRADLLKKELGIHTFADLLAHYPTSYLDRSSIVTIADIKKRADDDVPMMQLRGRFISFNMMGEGAKMRLVACFSDGTGTIEIVWFNRVRQIRQSLQTGTEYILFGKPTLFKSYWNIAHPEVDAPESVQANQGFHGVYPLTEKLRNQGSFTSRSMYTLMQTVLAKVGTLDETLPATVREPLRLIGRDQAIRAIHCPENHDVLQRARLRLKFEELFYIQLNMARLLRQRKQDLRGAVFAKIGHYFNSFYTQCLPFELTGAQKRVIREIREDVRTGRQMNRLLQGDVGSGKTLVALLSMLMALDNGTQACLMAPTEILATQHYETLAQMVAPIGVNIRLLTGSTRKKERDEIHAGLRDGSVHILIGTHAVIEDTVEFRNLGFVVIDEQHRFGVAQRARLWAKNALPPHVLVMTATPIPRTLAMTVYGDLDVSVIDELPPGRKPIVTLLRYENNRQEVYRALYDELRKGRQAYIVYPLIEESDKTPLKSVLEGFESVKQVFPDFQVAMVHGRLKPAEKDYQMQLFASGQARILVATTVIEVGVNVPNATTMIIENAERFGLAQLHQLRGRVGRGGDQSYCVLMAKHEMAKDTRQRLQIMTSTTDGFVIAEADLKMRGPGDIEGTMQSGIALNLKIANLATDGQIIQLARQSADALLAMDPQLTATPDGRLAAMQLRKLFDHQQDWSRIS